MMYCIRCVLFVCTNVRACVIYMVISTHCTQIKKTIQVQSVCPHNMYVFRQYEILFQVHVFAGFCHRCVRNVTSCLLHFSLKMSPLYNKG